tara:strand:+ start:149 stop:1114 length:966 start_codon:yes stop_codon:yes gene_type:complete
MKNILITGITGQDGIFLTDLIIKKETKSNIVGISRSSSNKNFFKKLNYLNNLSKNNISLVNLELNNPSEVANFIGDFKPDFVYNLTGPSSPSESIKNPETYKSIENIFENLTKALIKSENYCNFFQASSSEMYAENKDSLDEDSEYLPKSPYAIYKYKNHLKIQNLKKKFDWNIYSGIMFNHESEFRDSKYLIMSLINSAIQISNGQKNSFKVGSLDYIRDWSFAGDVAEAIYKITNFGKESNYVIGSGNGHTIAKMIEILFSQLELNYEEYIKIDKSLIRKGDPIRIVSNPSRLINELSWKPKLSFEELVERCLSYRLKN